MHSHLADAVSLLTSDTSVSDGEHNQTLAIQASPTSLPAHYIVGIATYLGEHDADGLRAMCAQTNNIQKHPDGRAYLADTSRNANRRASQTNGTNRNPSHRKKPAEILTRSLRLPYSKRLSPHNPPHAPSTPMLASKTHCTLV